MTNGIREEMITRVLNWVSDKHIDIGSRADQAVLVDAILSKVREALPKKRACSTHSLNDNDFTNDGEHCVECGLNVSFNAALADVRRMLGEKDSKNNAEKSQTTRAV